jgi:hypothetical protein
MPVPKHISVVIGEQYFESVYNFGHTARFMEVFRMDRQVFDRLLDGLLRNGLENSINISGGQKLGIFIDVLKGFQLSAKLYQKY